MDARSVRREGVQLLSLALPGSLFVIAAAVLTVSGAAPAVQARAGAPGIVLAAGRGNPWINLGDGAPIAATYAGPEAATRALIEGQAEPRSLASADFDGDGTDDLAIGYADAAGGLLVLQAGNPDFMYPDHPAAVARRAAGMFVDAPFLPTARVFALPVSPDFLAAGDFDADGRADVVAAAYGEDALIWLPGDGQGGFGAVRTVDLPGAVTALAVGEINRRDGLADVVVGVTEDPKGFGKPLGSVVLVFEGPDGALRAESEVFAMAAPITGLALAALDDDPYYDLAITAGNELVIEIGRAHV